MSKRLWANINGAVRCQSHAGSYLKSAVAAHPKRTQHVTPLDVWEQFTEPGWACELCGGLD